MDAPMEYVRAFGWLGAIGVNLLFGWIAWSLRKKFVTREDCVLHRKEDALARERFSELMAAHENSMRELTLKLKAVPDQDCLHSIDLKLVRIEGEQSRLAEELRGMRDILERVENQTTLLMRDRMERQQ